MYLISINFLQCCRNALLCCYLGQIIFIINANQHRNLKKNEAAHYNGAIWDKFGNQHQDIRDKEKS